LASDSVYSGAALVHDWLYRTRRSCAGSMKTITKGEADRVFYELMLQDGVRKRESRNFSHVSQWSRKTASV
jgi:Protein of unknown function (DUF1353)